MLYEELHETRQKQLLGREQIPEHEELKNKQTNKTKQQQKATGADIGPMGPKSHI